MKMIRPFSTAILATSMLSLSARAQDFKEIPVEPDAADEPLSMEQLFERERAKALAAEADESDMPREQMQMLRRLMQERMRDAAPGEVRRESRQTDARPGWMIGIAVEPLEPFVREHLDIEEGTGARVSMVMKDSPAAKAGIVMNDIILTANGDPVASLDMMKVKVAEAAKQGTPLVLETLHHGERKAVTLNAPAPEKAEKKDKAEARRPKAEANQRLAGVMRRLERQEKQIAKLREEVAKLREKVEEE